MGRNSSLTCEHYLLCINSNNTSLGKYKKPEKNLRDLVNYFKVVVLVLVVESKRKNNTIGGCIPSHHRSPSKSSGQLERSLKYLSRISFSVAFRSHHLTDSQVLSILIYSRAPDNLAFIIMSMLFYLSIYIHINIYMCVYTQYSSISPIIIPLLSQL